MAQTVPNCLLYPPICLDLSTKPPHFNFSCLSLDRLSQLHQARTTLLQFPMSLHPAQHHLRVFSSRECTIPLTHPPLESSLGDEIVRPSPPLTLRFSNLKGTKLRLRRQGFKVSPYSFKTLQKRFGRGARYVQILP